MYLDDENNSSEADDGTQLQAEWSQGRRGQHERHIHFEPNMLDEQVSDGNYWD